MYTAVEKTRLSMEIAQQIRHHIANGLLKPGDQLPPERELCRTLNVSRTSLREALRLLELLGFIKTNPGRGTFVRDVQPELPDLSSMNLTLLRQEDLLEQLFEFRDAIEPKLAYLAARNATDQQVAEMEECCNLMAAQAAQKQFLEFVLSDVRLHELIGAASGNRLLSQVLDAMRDLLVEVRQISTFALVRERLEDTINEHVAIVAAIRAHDRELAEMRMRSHLRALRSFYQASSA